MQNQQHPQYIIQTVGDFLKVPEDRLDACLEEFKTFLEQSRAFTKAADTLEDLIGGDKSKTVVQSYVWIDDGEKNVTIRISPNEA
jgi:hypothetical protein